MFKNPLWLCVVARKLSDPLESQWLPTLAESTCQKNLSLPHSAPGKKIDLVLEFMSDKPFMKLFQLVWKNSTF
jgi:hypothetical protein